MLVLMLLVFMVLSFVCAPWLWWVLLLGACWLRSVIGLADKLMVLVVGLLGLGRWLMVDYRRNG